MRGVQLLFPLSKEVRTMEQKKTGTTKRTTVQKTTTPKEEKNMNAQELFETMRAKKNSKSETMLALYDVLKAVGKVRDVFVSNGVNVSYNFVYNVVSKAGKLEKSSKEW
jgi:hypothetical protein